MAARDLVALRVAPVVDAARVPATRRGIVGPSARAAYVRMNLAVAAQVVCRSEAHLKNPFHATACAQRVNPRGTS